jgi:hypothetical protein
MANIKEHFDVEQIIGVKFFPESKAGFDWVEAIPEKRIFFGLIPWRSGRPAGFLDLRSYDGTIYTEKQLKGYGYKVYSYNERVQQRVCNKPYVTIYLSHDLQVTKRFETDVEAESWIGEIKAASGKVFEVINHIRN